MTPEVNQTAAGTATAIANAEGTSAESRGRNLYVVEGPAGTLKFGYWNTPPAGSKAITTRDELFEACANYTKSDILEALSGILNI
jgi:hypothetical protein